MLTLNPWQSLAGIVVTGHLTDPVFSLLTKKCPTAVIRPFSSPPPFVDIGISYDWEKMGDSLEESRLYYPLEEDEFRLLLVSPGQPGDQLICNLVHASYDDPPPYEALSYVWGSMDPPYFLNCSDVQVRVTKNLHEALCHFRLESQIRIVWADALCINQSDNPEKSIQVNRMREIYENCANLLVWFGAPAPGVAEDAWEGLHRLRTLFEEHTDVETLRYTKQARNLSDGITKVADKLTEW
jgi:hypothetical protein